MNSYRAANDELRKHTNLLSLDNSKALLGGDGTTLLTYFVPKDLQDHCYRSGVPLFPSEVEQLNQINKEIGAAVACNWVEHREKAKYQHELLWTNKRPFAYVALISLGGMLPPSTSDLSNLLARMEEVGKQKAANLVWDQRRN